MADIHRNRHHKQQSIEERLDDLRRRGILVPSEAPRQALKPVARRPGALARFLAQRGG
ncbi:MAG: hypothetical protein OXH06_19370 [Gemmatimonadetes bacterium]|nr:hypothetical protein [Gemmatimonadota bacterium]